MSTHNICFYGELRKITIELSSNTLLICSTGLKDNFPYFSITSRLKGNNHSPESNMARRSNMVFSVIKVDNSIVNSPLWPDFKHM